MVFLREAQEVEEDVLELRVGQQMGAQCAKLHIVARVGESRSLPSMADGEELLCERTATHIMQSDRLAHDPLGLRLAQIL